MNSDELVVALVHGGFTPQEYSGKFMFGATCVGVTLDNPAELGTAVAIGTMAAAIRDKDVDKVVLMQQLQDFQALVKQAKQDSMGLGYIIYWPDMAWPGDIDEGAMTKLQKAASKMRAKLELDPGEIVGPEVVMPMFANLLPRHQNLLKPLLEQKWSDSLRANLMNLPGYFLESKGDETLRWIPNELPDDEEQGR